MREIASIIETLHAAPGATGALATLVAVQGSSYRRPGARTLILGGRRIGSISGGCLEEDVRLRAERVLRTGLPEVVTYDTTQDNDLVWGLNTGCRGVVRVLIEQVPPLRPRWVPALAEGLAQGRATELGVVYGGAPDSALGTFLRGDEPQTGTEVFRERFNPPPGLIIFGAGDDAVPLVRMAKMLGWRVTVVDSRPAYATRERFPDADVRVVTPSGSMDEHVELDAAAFTVVMTHRFTEDLGLLRILLARPLRYLGLLGPRNRTERLLALLRREGAPQYPGALAGLCAPVGLDLGATTPESIALSILAEMQGRLTGRAPIPLRERSGAIHG